MTVLNPGLKSFENNEVFEARYYGVKASNGLSHENQKGSGMKNGISWKVFKEATLCRKEGQTYQFYNSSHGPKTKKLCRSDMLRYCYLKWPTA